MPPITQRDQYETAFACTCRQIRSELLPIYCEQTEFDIVIVKWDRITTDMIAWRDLLPDDLAKQVRHLYLIMFLDTGFASPQNLLRIMEENFHEDCKVRLIGSNRLCDAFGHAFDIGHRARWLGATWEEVSAMLNDALSILSLSRFDGR